MNSVHSNFLWKEFVNQLNLQINSYQAVQLLVTLLLIPTGHFFKRLLTMQKKLFFFFLFTFGIAHEAFSQTNTCGFDFMRQQQNTNVVNKQKEAKTNSILYERALNPLVRNKFSQFPLQIPVVVHIIHQNGPENISDSIVIAAINQLNLRFQNAAPYYDSTGHDMAIQFCLATVDPQGNPTTGITRDSSALTVLNVNDDVLMKNINRWDPYYYFNVWTVDQIHGFNISVAGYATMPSNIGDSYDGVVTLAGSLNSTVLAHEAAHYLGLYHTWNFAGNFPDCINYNCLLDGDLVCDTPPDTSRDGCMDNSCSSDMDDTTGFSPFVSDVNELPNYMDYNTCPLSFSQGQGGRMNNVITAIRYLLLQSAGCGFTGGAAPVAQMSYAISPCNDGVVYFSDSLSSNITTVNWDFDNNGTYESFLHNAVYTFPATGNYTIKLLVTGPGGVDSVFQTIFVQKAPSLYYPIATLNGIFPNQNGGWNSCGNFTVNFTSAPAQSYLWSTGDTTQSVSFIPSTTFTLTLTIVDSAGLTWTNQLCNPLVVNVHPLPSVPFIYSNDSLTICDGDTVTFHSTINPPGSYAYQWYQNGSAQSGAYDSVFSAIGFFPGISYQLIINDTNGCYNYSNLLYVYSYNAPLQQSLTQNNFQLISGWGSGNQWYLNNVPIAGATGTTYNVTQPGCYSVAWFLSVAPECYTMSDTICFTTVGLIEMNVDKELFFVSPNPFTEEFTVYSLQFPLKATMYDIFGREVLSQQLTTINHALSTAEGSKLKTVNIAKGIYFLEVITDKNRIIKKIVKE